MPTNGPQVSKIFQILQLHLSTYQVLWSATIIVKDS